MANSCVGAGIVATGPIQAPELFVLPWKHQNEHKLKEIQYCIDKKSWQFLHVTQDSENPGPRISHGMVSFTPRKGIMFGGYHQNKFFDTTYIFTLPYNGYITWTKINSDYGPSKRCGFGMVLIKRPDNVPSKHIACLFGGTSEGGRVNHGDTWCFDDSTNSQSIILF